MRLWRGLCGLLLFFLPLQGAEAADKCDMREIVADLKAGTLRESTFPAGRCTLDERELALAFSGFIDGPPQPDAEKVQEMFEAVRAGYGKTGNSARLERFSVQLVSEFVSKAKLGEKIRVIPWEQAEGKEDQDARDQLTMVALVLSIAAVLINLGILLYIFFGPPAKDRMSNASWRKKSEEDLRRLDSTYQEIERAPREIEEIRRALAGEIRTSRDTLVGLEAKIGRIDDLHQEFGPTVKALASRLTSIEGGAGTLTRLLGEFRVLKKDTESLFARIPTRSPGTLPASNLLALEREVLGEAWRKFRDNKEWLASIEDAPRDNHWQEICGPLLVDLPVDVPEELKPTFDATLAPARDYYNLVSKLSIIPRLTTGELGALPSEAEELTRLREFSQLLNMILNSNLVSSRLSFRLERWIADQFLGFADLFLQRFQQARLEGRNDVQLASGMPIILRVLKVANLEPVDLVLGRTLFESTKHMGRSTANRPDLPNGVIVGVVRNGFVRGGQVVRQPEVIVNRLG